MPEGRDSRKGRANGAESRRRILAAAREVAGERGYDGTSISLVSERCGLPASSIYWHFANKDALIAAVLEESFGVWVRSVAIPTDAAGSPVEWGTALAMGTARALRDSPEFLRVGLMLALERRPAERSVARATFHKLRDIGYNRITEFVTTLAPEADAETVALFATYAIAAADGLFLAAETRGDEIDLEKLFAFHAKILMESLARHISSAAPVPPPSPER
jgi:AcrR family transcriptional regulator